MYNILGEKYQEESTAYNSETINNQDREAKHPLAEDRLERIHEVLGSEAILIPYTLGTKKPMRTAWQQTTLEQTRDPAYIKDLRANNIGVLVGPESGNLIDVDCDTEEFMHSFIQANTEICANTLESKGERGGHFWFRMVGEYPTKVEKITDDKGEPVGEFRGGKGGSLISGTHPSGSDYMMGDKPPLEIKYEDIKWPNGFSLKLKTPAVGGVLGNALRGTSYGIGDVGQMGKTRQSRLLTPSVEGEGNKFDKAVIEDLRLQLPEYLKRIGVNLKPQGKGLIGLCPHHDDHNPSFGVFGDAHEKCGCFTCNHTGDVFDTSQWLGRSNSFPESVREVADTLGYLLPNVAVAVGVTNAPRGCLEQLEPLEDEQQDTPFPVHCIPGVAGEMAKEIARVTTSQDLPLAAASVIGVLSASLGAGIEVPCGGERRSRGNLYILAIAASGTGKGEAFSLAGAPFDLAQSEHDRQFEEHDLPELLAKLSVAEQRSKELQKQAAREEEKLKRDKFVDEYQKAVLEIANLQKQIAARPQLKVEDTTKEALAVAMSGQPGGAIASLSSEARGVFSILKGRYGKEGGDEDYYCKCYSGESVKINRIGRGILALDRTCLSIVWMVQPDAARSALGTEALTESGLLPRFLMFDPKAEPLERLSYPDPIPTSVKIGWSNLVLSLVQNYRAQGDKPLTVEKSGGVDDVMLEFENENIRLRRRSGEYHDFAEYVARWTENTWRLSLVLHCAKYGTKAHVEKLEISTARDSIEIVRWFIEKQLEILAAGRYEKARSKVSAVLAVLADVGGEISLRDFRRSHSVDEEEIKQLQAKFPKDFKIVERKAATGRPSVVVTNRPEDMKG